MKAAIAVWCAAALSASLLAAAGKHDEPLQPEVRVFAKKLSATRKLVVTCKGVPNTLPPEEVARRAEEARQEPGVNHYSDHRYHYAFGIETGTSTQHLWTLQQGTFGKIRPGVSDAASGSIEILDVVLSGRTLYILLRRFDQPSVMVVDNDKRRGPKERQYDSFRGVEHQGYEDKIVSARLIVPTPDGRVGVEFVHVRIRREDGVGPRTTRYTMAPNGKGDVMWVPDPANTYSFGEYPACKEVRDMPAGGKDQAPPGR